MAKHGKKYLEAEKLVDRQNIPPADCQEAQRLSQRVRRDGKRRQLGDCLIRAIANRLNFDVLTNDEGFAGR